ncbi:MAG: hypothetical protein F6J98_33840 [Moorea sp. SIO4G2]|nr:MULTISPECIES: hypothetical protein [Moorena]NEO65110.1 hypothetical protein [Moorena sp. SIO4G2]NEP29160.1 hypothetical protein [Moorena sp. SIO3I6]
MNCSSFNLPYTRPLGKNNLGQKATRFAAKRDFVHRVQPSTFNLDNLQP